ncbi:hypothetical protein [Streptomyces sp. NPDC048057]|uniref:NACHT domain-containing protein n=1 Tax=Streptomyces sp. NPDC048057 TaxID=3155628 RepID=UPI0033DD7F79
MRGRRQISYRDAVAILTGDSAALAAADRALGGVLSVATGGVSDAVLNMLDAQGRVLRLGRDLTANLRGSLSDADRVTRTDRIHAAHSVLVISAWFEALGEVELPFGLEELELTGRDQVAIASGTAPGVDLVESLVDLRVDPPAPHRPFEDHMGAVRSNYRSFQSHFIRFASGLAVYDRLDPHTRDDELTTAGRAVTHCACDRYQQLYGELAVEVPEFGFWSGQVDHQATRTLVRRSLTGVEAALAGLSTVQPHRHAAAALTTGYRAALAKPILSEGHAPAGVRLPTLEEGYVDPDFRLRAVAGTSRGPADEEFWSEVEPRSDLIECLSGLLTAPATTRAPLMVLGQPGAGKSVLTRILAARLPSAGYLPVRILLREVPSDLDVQDQIEWAVRAATGERVPWPELVRAAGDSVPVLLFDGYDELLQATGISQSDFLLRVARFQEREADQDRPVYAIVTSRTAVADRPRYPEGAVALRLEPFSAEQVTRWLELWNRLNSSYLAGRGLVPLPAPVALRHGELASQPLLLLMLALYDGTANALQQETVGDTPFDASHLYEELLTSFASREVAKSSDFLTGHRLAERAEQELQRLSLISFGMLNRRRQWITSQEAEDDLTALLGRAESVGDGRRAPLGQGDIALGRFFFVQRSQALRDAQRLATYEFLHATFGEYLVARLSVQLLEGLLAQRPALAVGRARINDDLPYVLLSYATLASRQILRFATARIELLPAQERERLVELLLTVLADHRNRTEHAYADYRPEVRATSSRHGLYSANVILLAVLVSPEPLRASRLFPGADKPAALWHRRALLWRSAFRESEWTEFALALDLRQCWTGEQQDLSVMAAARTTGEPEPVDAHWLYGRRLGDEEGPVSWARSQPDEVHHKMMVSGGTNDLLVLHALDPYFAVLPRAVTAVESSSTGPSTSVARMLTALWLTSGLHAAPDELASRYYDCARVMTWNSSIDEDTRYEVRRLVLRQLVLDAHRLPLDVVLFVISGCTDDQGRNDHLDLTSTVLLSLLTESPRQELREEVQMYLELLGAESVQRLLALCALPHNPAARSVLHDVVAPLLARATDDGVPGVPAEVLAGARAFVADHRCGRPPRGAAP